MFVKDFKNYFDVLMAEAKQVQSIANLAKIHDHLYRHRSYENPHWREAYETYREFADREVMEMQRQNIKARQK